MTTDLLKTSGVSAGYGDVQVLHDVDITVGAGEIVCLIGSNGAGKTTLLRTLSGMAKAVAGDITFADRLFGGMTVRENLLMGAYMRNDGRAIINNDLDFVLKTFPRLAERLNQDASTLSGGEQQMCAIGRGIMANPLLLLIDELSLGLSPKLVGELGKALVEINKAGLSILLVEQDVATALRLATTGFVLDTGRIVLSGPTVDLAVNPSVRQAYLGIAAA
jgi:branched-chain amino acid transport system ATP-binding protein